MTNVRNWQTSKQMVTCNSAMPSKTEGRMPTVLTKSQAGQLCTSWTADSCQIRNYALPVRHTTTQLSSSSCSSSLSNLCSIQSDNSNIPSSDTITLIFQKIPDGFPIDPRNVRGSFGIMRVRSQVSVIDNPIDWTCFQLLLYRK